HVDEDVVVRAERAAAIEIGWRGAGRAVPTARDRVHADMVIAEVDAREIDHDVLLRDLDALADAGHLALHDGGEDPDRRVKPGARVAQAGLDADRRAIGAARQAHDAAHRLRDHLEALVSGVGPLAAEALDRGADDARVDSRERLVAEAQALHRSRTEVLDHD